MKSEQTIQNEIIIEEIWKPVINYKGFYEISNFGRVRSVDREFIKRNGTKVNYKGRLIKVETTYQGYKRVRLSKRGIDQKYNVHRLVAEAFIGPYPDGKVINHIDENRANNYFENLEYVTQKENINYGNRTQKMIESQSVKIKGTNLKTGEVIYFSSMSEAKRKSNGYFHDGHISQTIKGKHKHHKGYKWEKVIE